MQKILAIGPHPDDIELGCYGTLARLTDEGNEVHFLVLTKGTGGTQDSDRVLEAEESAGLIKANLYIENLQDRFISDGWETISVLEKYVEKIKPNQVYIPTASDTHQDHRATFNAAMVACRPVREIYAYETPSTSRNFTPNIFVDISKYIDLKLQAIKIHISQGVKGYMADRAIKGLAEYRAFDIFLNDKYVEGFDAIKVVK